MSGTASLLRSPIAMALGPLPVLKVTRDPNQVSAIAESGAAIWKSRKTTEQRGEAILPNTGARGGSRMVLTEEDHTVAPRELTSAYLIEIHTARDRAPSFIGAIPADHVGTGRHGAVYQRTNQFPRYIVDPDGNCGRLRQIEIEGGFWIEWIRPVSACSVRSRNVRVRSKHVAATRE